MREVVLRYFFVTVFLHSFAKGIYYVGHQSDEALPFQSSHRTHGDVSSQLFGTWSEWSHCSKSCGMGLTKRNRSCNVSLARSLYRDENVCHKESVEYKVCTTKFCPPGTPDVRADLCSRYNGRLVAGQRAKSWTPVNQGSNPCELRCEATEEKFVYGFGKVDDGTPCDGGLCIDGRCLKIGCDDKLGSSATVADMCGVCGGRNESCVHYKDLFVGQREDSHSDDRRGKYHEILLLPVGARNFEITQNVGENVIAMRDRSTAVLFYDSVTREQSQQKLAGTIMKHALIDHNRTEVYRAAGPTTLSLQVSVLLLGRNYGIRYEYWLPREEKPTQNHHATRSTSRYEQPSNPTRTTQRIRTIYKPVWSPATTPSTVTPVYYKTAAYIPTSREENPMRFNKASQSSSSWNTSSYFKNQQASYGPKLRAPVFAKYFPTQTPGDRYPVARNDLINAIVLPGSHEDVAIEERFAARSGLIAPKFANHRTEKPTFNYYERFRNSTFRAPVNIYRQKPEQALQQTQRDSGDSNNKIDAAQDAVPTNKTNEVKTDVAYRDANVHNFGHGVRKPNPRWEYKVNGKANGSADAFSNQRQTTAVSISVLPLPDGRGNHTNLRSDKKITGKSNHHHHHHSKGWSSRAGACGPCHKVKNQARHFCTSDFVIRAIVLGHEFVHGETRYELQVLQSFKNTFSLLTKEYIWSPDTCRCPKLRIGKEYVIMGRSDNNFRRNESRLLIDGHSFVRTYNLKQDRRLLKLRKNQAKKCSKIS